MSKLTEAKRFSPPAQPEIDPARKVYGVKQLATILVKDKSGNLGRINAADFNPELHIKVE